MSEPKRPGQGRSAVPEFTEGDFAVHEPVQAAGVDRDAREHQYGQYASTPYALVL